MGSYQISFFRTNSPEFYRDAAHDILVQYHRLTSEAANAMIDAALAAPGKTQFASCEYLDKPARTTAWRLMRKTGFTLYNVMRRDG